MHPLILITALLVLVFAAIGLLVARVRRRMRRLPQNRRQCPACAVVGHALGYGRYRCAACGHRFVVNLDGQPVGSLFAAIRWPFAVWVLGVGGWLAWETWRDRKQWFGLIVFAVLTLVSLALVACPKKFQPDETV